MSSETKEGNQQIKNDKSAKQSTAQELKPQVKPENHEKIKSEASKVVTVSENTNNKTEAHEKIQVQQFSTTKEEQQKENEGKGFERKQMYKIKTNEEIQMEVKKWKQISQTLQKKRQIQYELLKKKLQFEKQKEIQSNKQKFQKQQQEKRQQIKKRLEEINLRKQKRNQSIQNEKKRRKQATSQQKKDPLYQEKEKQFHMKKLVEQAKIRQNIIKKKQQMMLDMNELREHQQKFLNHLKQRLSKKKKTGQHSPAKQGEQGHLEKDSSRNHKSSFNIFLGGADSAQKQKDKEKYLRRKKFQQKVKKIPIFIDEQKMKQALIAKDKSKNPLKYNYLSNVAALSDEKIYEEFKDFEININQKQIGNDYMRQVHENIPEASRIRSQSESRLKPLQKPEYKNYMPDVKAILKKKVYNQKSKPNDQVQQILFKYETNSDRLVQLNRKSDYYKNQVLKKIAQIRSTSPTTAYTDYLGKERAIDDLYMKSIKMKIATAHIS